MQTDDPERLKQQIRELKDRVRELEEKGANIFKDDMYEYLVVACTKAMNEKLADALAYTREAYSLMSEKDKYVRKILSYFEGKTVREKKRELFNFIKENPVYRTKSPQLLLQRLRYTKKYGDILSNDVLPQTPLKDAIDRSNTPLQETKEEEEYLD